jgi:hypothetical protein
MNTKCRLPSKIIMFFYFTLTPGMAPSLLDVASFASYLAETFEDVDTVIDGSLDVVHIVVCGSSHNNR